MGFNPLKAVAAAATLTVLLASPVSAAPFTYVFSNVDGNTPGTVEGTIILPDGDGVFVATSITVDSAPAALGYTTPFDILSNLVTTVAHSFTVSGGQIDASNSAVALVFNLGTPSESVFSLGFPGFGSLLGVNGNPATDGVNGVVDVNNSTLEYAGASTVPVPAGLPLLGGALAILAVMRRRT